MSDEFASSQATLSQVELLIDEARNASSAGRQESHRAFLDYALHAVKVWDEFEPRRSVLLRGGGRGGARQGTVKLPQVPAPGKPVNIVARVAEEGPSGDNESQDEGGAHPKRDSRRSNQAERADSADVFVDPLDDDFVAEGLGPDKGGGGDPGGSEDTEAPGGARSGGGSGGGGGGGGGGSGARHRTQLDAVLLRRVHRINGAITRMRETLVQTMVRESLKEARAVETGQPDTSNGAVRRAGGADGDTDTDTDGGGGGGAVDSVADALRARLRVAAAGALGGGDVAEAAAPTRSMSSAPPAPDSRLVVSAERLRTALAIARHRSLPASRRRLLSITALNALCAVLRLAGDLDGSEEAAVEALDWENNNAAAIAEAEAQGGSADKLDAIAAAVGSDSQPDPAATRLNLCATLSCARRHLEARDAAAEAVAALHEMARELELRKDVPRTVSKPIHVSLVVAHQNLAVQLRYLYKVDEATKEYVRAMRCAWAKLGPAHPLTRRVERGLCEMLDNPDAAQALRLGLDPHERLSDLGIPLHSPHDHDGKSRGGAHGGRGSKGRGPGRGESSDIHASVRSSLGKLSTMSDVAAVMSVVDRAATAAVASTSKIKTGTVQMSWLTEGLGSLLSASMSSREAEFSEVKVSFSEPHICVDVLWMPNYVARTVVAGLSSSLASSAPSSGAGSRGTALAPASPSRVASHAMWADHGAEDGASGGSAPVRFGLYALRTRFKEPLSMFGSSVPKAAVAAARHRRASIVSGLSADVADSVGAAGARPRTNTGTSLLFEALERQAAAGAATSGDGASIASDRASGSGSERGSRADAPPGSRVRALSSAASLASASADGGDGVIPEFDPRASELRTLEDELPPYALPRLTAGSRTVHANFGLSLPLPRTMHLHYDELPVVLRARMHQQDHLSRGGGEGQGGEGQGAAVGDDGGDAPGGDLDAEGNRILRTPSPAPSVYASVPTPGAVSASGANVEEQADEVSSFETLPQKVRSIPMADAVVKHGISVRREMHKAHRPEPGLEFVRYPRVFGSGVEKTGMSVTLSTGLAIYNIAPKPQDAMLLDAASMRFVYKLVMDKELVVPDLEPGEADDNFVTRGST